MLDITLDEERLMGILAALILGIIQGLTEFLPISSSGHLMVVEHLFGIEGGSLFFNVLVHFAKLISVVLVFWKDVIYLIKHPFSKRMLTIVLACIPTIIIALVVEFLFDEFSLMAFVGFGFLISAIVISITSFLQARKKPFRTLEVGNGQALTIGFVQGLAVFPGISRSGSTICAGLMLGVEREEAAKFSFLISLPVILGGMVFEVADGIKSGFGAVNALACLVGFIAAFAVAILTIKLMMKIVKKGSWWPFAVYLFIIATLVLLNQFVFAWF